MKKKRVGRIAAVVAVIALLTGLVTYAVAPTLFGLGTKPTLKFSGFEFKVMDDADSSIQMLVTVSISDFLTNDLANGTAYTLISNNDYLVPSNAKTNAAIGTAASTQAFFQLDSLLAVKSKADGTLESPFEKKRDNPTIPWGSVQSQPGGKEYATSMALLLSNDLVTTHDPLAGSPLGRVVINPGAPAQNFYLDTTAPVTLGKLSFRLNKAKLPELVTLLASGTPADRDKVLKIGATNGWELHYLRKDSRDVYSPNTYQSTEAQALVDLKLPRTLVGAEAARKTVEINAYQAYTDGTEGDLAATLQRYSPTVRKEYSNGDFEDEILRWGDTTAGYKVEKWDGAAYVATAPGDYDPTGGKYRVSQTYSYLEGTNTVQYPKPITVELTVTPVTATGISTDRLERTYAATAAADLTYLGLKLPEQGLLRVNPVPGTASLNLPVGAWTPQNQVGKTLGDWLTQADGATKWPAAGTYSFTKVFTQAAIKAAYPWLTVTQDFPITATRTVVADGATTDVVNYTATASTTTQGELQVAVKRVDNAALAAGTQFKLRLPNGEEVVIDWFQPDGGGSATGYFKVRNTGDGVDLLPSDVGAVSTYAAQRDAARRYINLGGWFSVAVQEDGGKEWSDYIPVYSAPRANEYTKSYAGSVAADNGGTFDFSGAKQGLFPFTADTVLGKSVVLPIGYTVSTTYDGATGAEGGALSTVRVDAPWSASNGTEVAPPWPAGKAIIHGAQNFAALHVFDGYGRVSNSGNKQVQINTQVSATVPRNESGLFLDGPTTAGVIKNPTGEVTEVVYNTRQVGYTYRQEMTLTLKNKSTATDGSGDIYGLYLDVGTKPTPTGDTPPGHFEVIKPPAAYLPAGGETTFVVTYVYDLRVKPGEEMTGSDYVDELIVCSNQSGGAALKTFTARFKVAAGKVSRVDVVTDLPAMGEGTVIVGLPERTPSKNDEGTWLPGDPMNGDPGVPAKSTTDKPNLTDGLTDYVEKYEWVWVYPEPDDEYEVKEIYYYVENVEGGTKVPLYRYEYTDPVSGEITNAYFFRMPEYDVTVHVDYYEPTYSKLRLSKLQVYAGTKTETGMTTDGDLSTGSLLNPAYLQPLRRLDDTTVLVNGEDLQSVEAQPNKVDNRSVNDFLVVLEAQDEYLQLSATLRLLLKDMDTTENLTPSVWMYWTDPEVENTVYNIYGEQNNRIPGNTAVDGDTTPGANTAPSRHDSALFQPAAFRAEDATAVPPIPAPATDKYIDVYIELSSGGTPDVTRVIHIRVAKKGELPAYSLNPGNSPYGLIENDADIINKVAAKEAFDKSLNFTVGFTADLLPAKAAGLTATYWREAWGATLPATAAEGNYDKNLDVLFVYQGQPFDDPGVTGARNTAGLLLEPADISRRVEVKLLDTAAATQVLRFTGTGATQRIELGTGDVTRVDKVERGTADAPNPQDWWKDAGGTAYAVRPGVYQLVYAFLDYDGTERSFTRPLVILPPLGDVNADLQSAFTADQKLIKGRVGDPLGYAAGTTAYPDALLFQYRVCDANNDRNINNIDANHLGKATPPVAFYRPTDYKNETVTTR